MVNSFFLISNFYHSDVNRNLPRRRHFRRRIPASPAVIPANAGIHFYRQIPAFTSFFAKKFAEIPNLIFAKNSRLPAVIPAKAGRQIPVRSATEEPKKGGQKDNPLLAICYYFGGSYVHPSVPFSSYHNLRSPATKNIATKNRKRTRRLRFYHFTGNQTMPAAIQSRSRSSSRQSATTTRL